MSTYLPTTSRRTRVWLSAAALSVSGLAAGYYLYSWWKGEEAEASQDQRDLSTPTFGGSGSNAAAAQLETEADANLQSHFDSIQIISERTTLPQMLAELGKGLNRHADVATLVLQLKHAQRGAANMGVCEDVETPLQQQQQQDVLHAGARTAGGCKMTAKMFQRDAGLGFLCLSGPVSTIDLATLLALRPDDGEGAKLEIWTRLKLLAFTRAACIAWLVPLLDLLLRVQLNVLGRHLFLESHLLDRAGAQSWGDTAPGAQRVTKRAQELFLEVAHYLPEKGARSVVARLQQAVQDTLGDVTLDQPLSRAQVLDCLSAVHAEFETWVAAESWAAVILPSSGETAAYFRGSQARPDNGALVPNASPEADEDIARRMVSELRTILSSAKFAAAAQGAVQEMARSLASSLWQQLGPASLPVAKVLPKVVAVTDSFMAPQSPQRSAALGSIAALPAVQKLCATVYSCGPPL